MDLELGDALLALLDGALPTLDGGSLQLDGTELLASTSDLGLCLREPCIALRELAQQLGELGLARLELGGPDSEHALDRRARVADELFTTLELLDRAVQPRGVLVELATAFREYLVETLLRVGSGRERLAHARAEPLLLRVLLLLFVRHDVRPIIAIDADGSTLSRRVRSDPPARAEFAGSAGFPALVTHLGEGKGSPREKPICLAWTRKVQGFSRRGFARVSRSESRIELVAAPHDDSGLCAGDRGIVDQIDEHGHVVVSWDRGFASEIDPQATPIHPLAA